MSLILDALRKAKRLAGGGAPKRAPAYLKSFGFSEQQQAPGNKTKKDPPSLRSAGGRSGIGNRGRESRSGYVRPQNPSSSNKPKLLGPEGGLIGEPLFDEEFQGVGLFEEDGVDPLGSSEDLALEGPEQGGDLQGTTSAEPVSVSDLGGDSSPGTGSGELPDEDSPEADPAPDPATETERTDEIPPPPPPPPASSEPDALPARTSLDDTDAGNDDARTEDLVDAPVRAGPPVEESEPSPGEVQISGPASGSFELALFYVQSGQHLKALEIYEDLFENNPMDASVHNNIGVIHLNTSNNAEAIQSFNNAILIDANYDTAQQQPRRRAPARWAVTVKRRECSNVRWRSISATRMP